MNVKNLNGKWRLYYCNHDEFSSVGFDGKEKSLASLPCLDGSVPGCFELDFMDAGLLPKNIFYSKNILELRKFENLHLFYVINFEKRFINEVIRFDGIDTFAEIYLNGKQVGYADNMLIGHEFPIESVSGDNELLVHILPTVAQAARYTLDREKYFFQIYNEESAYVRKAPHMFGWDILPRAVSGGIWKGVYIKENKREINDFYLATEALDEDGAVLNCSFSFDAGSDCVAVLSGVCGESNFSQTFSVKNGENVFRFRVKDPKLWFPRNYGEPALYDVTFTLQESGEKVAETTMRLGIRTVALERTSVVDESGGKFCFYVNGQRIYIMGTNWVPLDPFHAREHEFLERALNAVLELNCNAIRCWGGNVYPDEDFYSFCDEHGIFVWQDFSMACGVYPTEPIMFEAMRKESTAVVKRLRNHASLCIWAGDNECDITYRHIKRNPAENSITREVIADVLRALDPYRPYLPSSPYYDEIASSSAFSPTEEHTWGDRTYFKGEYYNNTQCIFCSEAGFFGLPKMDSLRKFISPEQLINWRDEKGFDDFKYVEGNFIDNLNAQKAHDDWLLHSTCMETVLSPYSYRIPLCSYAAHYLFPETENESTDTFVKKSQIAQMEGYKYTIERYRLSKWRRTGLIWWNLRDGWPAISEALLDYYFEKKLAFEIVKRVQNPVLVALRETESDAHEIVLCNDGRRDERVSVKIDDLTTGERVFEGTFTAVSDENVTIGKLPAKSDMEFYKIEFVYAGERHLSHYANNLIACDFKRYLACLRQLEIGEYEYI